MMKEAYQTVRRTLAISVAALAVVAVTPSAAVADVDFAKASLKKMSDYLASQDVISFDYDATCQVPADYMVACERVQGGRGTKF